MNLKDKVVVITGASRGLGREIAAAFSQQEAKVVITDLNEQELQTAAAEFNAIPMVLDVTNEDQVRQVAQAVVSQLGKIDIWVNNAGIWTPYVPMDQLSGAKAQQLMAVNFFGTFYGAQAAWSQMKKQGGGVIINIVSVRALEPRPGSAGYGASKGAAHVFTQTIAMEGQEFNIKVIGVYPSRMKTHLFDEQKPADYDSFLEPSAVVQKIIDNLKQENPQPQLIIKGDK